MNDYNYSMYNHVKLLFIIYSSLYSIPWQLPPNAVYRGVRWGRTQCHAGSGTGDVSAIPGMAF